MEDRPREAAGLTAMTDTQILALVLPIALIELALIVVALRDTPFDRNAESGATAS